jgi:hypothetical protein
MTWRALTISLNPGFLSYTASLDVARNSHESLPAGVRLPPLGAITEAGPLDLASDAPAGPAKPLFGRDLPSSTFRLNVSTSCGISRAVFQYFSVLVTVSGLGFRVRV